MKTNKLLFLLLFLVIAKGIVWSFLIPLWHFPDEQAHFGHVALNSEPENSRKFPKANLTEEIAISEKKLGTFRDHQGNNQFTYHPEYKLKYSDSFTGPSENYLKSLPVSTRFTKVVQESAYYPELFYNISMYVYNLFYSSNLFIRTFALRLFWLPLLALITWASFRLAFLVFGPKSSLPIIIAVAVAFQPMLTFVSSGITSDNLFNALFTLTILLSTLLIDQFSTSKLFLLAAITGLGMITKPQFIISLAIIFPAVFLSLIKISKTKKIINFKNFGLLIVFMILIYLFGGHHQINLLFKSSQLGIPWLYFGSAKKPLLPDYTILQHFVWTIKHTIREVVPWYWGVFRWLSLVLPRWANRVLIRLMLASLIGLVIKTIDIIKNKQFNRQNKLIAFIAYVGIVYFLALFIWDWSFFRNHNFSFGIQGRYYFPVIISHLFLFVFGLTTLIQYLFPKKINLAHYLLSIWMIMLNIIALVTVAGSYYDLSSFNVFLIQASQYKPFFAKNLWLISALALYAVLLLIFLIRFTKLIFIKNDQK